MEIGGVEEEQPTVESKAKKPIENDLLEKINHQLNALL